MGPDDCVTPPGGVLVLKLGSLEEFPTLVQVIGQLDSGGSSVVLSDRSLKCCSPSWVTDRKNSNFLV